ncbi:MAG: homoserine dehydrogenase [Candidatus Methylomirabilia bacterium]
MARRVRILLCGFGRVGRSFARLVEAKRALAEDAYGLTLELAGVGELAGSLLKPGGLAAGETAAFFETQGSFAGHPDARPEWKGIDLIREAEADVMVEATPTDIRTGEPALGHIRAALSRGMHVVSANKGPFIRHYHELRDLAAQKGAALKLSAAAAAALPTLDVAQTCLAGAEILSIEGVLNGTSNFILTRMRTGGSSYDEALAEAQRLGIAETDPTLDVEGYDTANKLALIANVCMEAGLLPERVERTGITALSAEEVRTAGGQGRIFRLMGRAERGPGGAVRARVAPEALPMDHPLAAVDGAEKGITYTTDSMHRVTVVGGKSDPRGAAAALLKDILNIYRVP